jgi:hypothetical protein
VARVADHIKPVAKTLVPKATPRIIGEVRLSGIHGVHDVDIPGGHVPPERRQMRDQAKNGMDTSEPKGGFDDETEKLRRFGLIP